MIYYLMLCTISRKNEFTIKGFFNKREQIHRKLHICSHLLTESFIYCAVILANVNDFPVYYTVFKTTYSEVKTQKLTSNFPTRIFWHVKGMNIPSQKMPGYKHGGVRNRVFMTSQRLDMAELATVMYLVNRMP